MEPQDPGLSRFVENRFWPLDNFLRPDICPGNRRESTAFVLPIEKIGRRIYVET